MLSLSIIVPATGRQTELDNTLVSVLENRPRNCEIIVPHAPTYQDPYDLGDEVQFISVDHEGVVDLINAGLNHCRSEIVHLLGTGCEVREGWADSPRHRFEEDRDLAAVSPKLKSADSPRPVVGISYRGGGSRRLIRARRSSRTIHVGAPCLQAGFFRRSDLMSLGGLDATLGAFYAEIDLAARMRQADSACNYDPESEVIGRAIDRPSGFRGSRQMQRVYWRHAAANGRIRSLAFHLMTLVGQSFPFVSPRAISSSFGHMVGATECLFRGCAYESSLDESPDTIQMRKTADAEEDLTERRRRA